MLKSAFFTLLAVFCFFTSHSQEKDSITIKQDTLKVEIDSVKKTLSKRELKQLQRQQKRDSIGLYKKEYNPLAPSKAAFYSALVPGLGQVYNKRYWKVPIVYGAIGTGLYFYVNNTNEYNRYRDAFKSRLAGSNTDEFWGIDAEGNALDTPRVSTDALQNAQEVFQRNKDLSLLITVGLYALNILDANIDAHLKQYNVNEDLTFRPVIYPNQFNNRPNFGMALTFDF